MAKTQEGGPGGAEMVTPLPSYRRPLLVAATAAAVLAATAAKKAAVAAFAVATAALPVAARASA